MNRVETFPIADVQNFPDHRRLAIDKVGIKSIRHPIAVWDKSGVQRTVATFNLAVHLPHHLKGTHMSRFVALLEQTRELSVDCFEPLLRDMLARLEAEAGSIEVRFPYFINKAAPVSGVESLMDYDVTLIGEIKEGRFSLTTKVMVAATSLCPCSKAISDYGAHNQRSHVTVSIQSDMGIWIEDIVKRVEAEASCEVYGLLKRPDEKYVTERAYDNPKFVEDMVRDVAARLGGDARIHAFEVEVENFESSHNHSAYAVISGQVPSAPASTANGGK